MKIALKSYSCQYLIKDILELKIYLNDSMPFSLEYSHNCVVSLEFCIISSQKDMFADYYTI